jgi:hypothetical protein
VVVVVVVSFGFVEVLVLVLEELGELEVEFDEFIVLGVGLFMFEPEAPPVEFVPPCDESVAELLVEPLVEPEVPVCAVTTPAPRARATAAARVSMRGWFLMMSVLLQVQGEMTRRSVCSPTARPS